MAGGMQALLLLLLFCASAISVQAIYCGDKSCYDLLGVPETATSADIKKAYYKLSLQYHPDKNPDPEAKKAFVNIANAYEILYDDQQREQYDYALAHPEEFFYNTARYYHAYYGHKTDLRLVFVGLAVVFSAFQYANQYLSFKQTMESIKQTPAYKNKLRAFEAEKNGGAVYNKKKSSRVKRDFSKEFGDSFDFQVHGVLPPTIRGLMGVQLLLLPYTLAKLAYWKLSWIWRYQIKKLDLNKEDSEYLTRTSLELDDETWKRLDGEERDHLVSQSLWNSANLDAYRNENRSEKKRKRR